MIDKLERELLRLKTEKELAEAWEEIDYDDEDICPICGHVESGCHEVGCLSDEWEDAE
jgi:hypothetical protein